MVAVVPAVRKTRLCPSHGPIDPAGHSPPCTQEGTKPQERLPSGPQLVHMHTHTFLHVLERVTKKHHVFKRNCGVCVCARVCRGVCVVWCGCVWCVCVSVCVRGVHVSVWVRGWHREGDSSTQNWVPAQSCVGSKPLHNHAPQRRAPSRCGRIRSWK